jgi:hypothetical protein
MYFPKVDCCVLFQALQVQIFYLLAGPGRFAQKRQTRFDAGIQVEATDVDLTAHFFPAVYFDQMEQDFFERDAVQWIIGLWILHGCGIAGILAKNLFCRIAEGEVLNFHTFSINA